MIPELIFDGHHDLAEGPVWRDGHLWWVNITAGMFHRLNPITGVHEQRHIGGNSGCAAPAEEGRWLVAHDRELQWLDWASGTLTPFCAVETKLPLNRFNDGKCDAKGRLWIGTMNREAASQAGALYVIEAGHNPRRVLDKLTIANGMAWSLDNRAFYFSDSATHRVDMFDFEAETGTISNRRALATFTSKDFPDGMTLDAEGNLWVALWGAGAVVCLDGKNGRQLQRICVPVSQPSSCTFGGAKWDELFITTARSGLSPAALEGEPHAGGIFCVRPGVCGSPAHLFNPQPVADCVQPV